MKCPSTDQCVPCNGLNRERELRYVPLGRKAWLADVLGRIAAYSAERIDELLPWSWRKDTGLQSKAA